MCMFWRAKSYQNPYHFHIYITLTQQNSKVLYRYMIICDYIFSIWYFLIKLVEIYQHMIYNSISTILKASQWAVASLPKRVYLSRSTIFFLLHGFLLFFLQSLHSTQIAADSLYSVSKSKEKVVLPSESHSVPENEKSCTGKRLYVQIHDERIGINCGDDFTIEKVLREARFIEIASVEFFQEKLQGGIAPKFICKYVPTLNLDQGGPQLLRFTTKLNQTKYSIDYYENGMFFVPVENGKSRLSPRRIQVEDKFASVLTFEDLIKVGLECTKKEYALGTHNCHFAMEAIYDVVAVKVMGTEVPLEGNKLTEKLYQDGMEIPSNESPQMENAKMSDNESTQKDGTVFSSEEKPQLEEVTHNKANEKRIRSMILAKGTDASLREKVLQESIAF
eukprot:TRINITY_DN2096_c0_g1_i1.p1 TRINITY_DN2096_c0_g1~~TRINITY_DN2096_c0_g1_i1.p1  ORF type:complete len:423 (-),score=-1.63 TRINITY_DN2096_c0_g1_i1:564-1736(-)